MDARKKYILEMRESGMTFRQIGKELGISAGRTNQIHREATRQRNRYCALSVRASNVLYHWGLWPDGVDEPSKQAIKAFIKKEGKNVYGYYMVGPVLIKEICHWAGTEAPLLGEQVCPVCGQVMHNRLVK